MTIGYDLAFATRKTLGITVRTDLTVGVRAPMGTTLEEIEAVVKKRAAWILKQQRELVRYLPHLPPRQYVSGESHRYLGRQYRLKVNASPENTPGVMQTRNTLEVTVADPADREHVKELLDAWYHARAEEVFAARLAAVLSQGPAPGPAVSAARGAGDALALGQLRPGRQDHAQHQADPGARRAD